MQAKTIKRDVSKFAFGARPGKCILSIARLAGYYYLPNKQTDRKHIVFRRLKRTEEDIGQRPRTNTTHTYKEAGSNCKF